MKNISIAALLFVLVFVFTSCSANQNNSAASIEAYGVKLVIPDRYLTKNDRRFDWIEETEGLDTNENSIKYDIPVEEIISAIPNLSKLNNNNITTLGGLIFIEGETKAKRSVEWTISIIEKMITKKGDYADVVFEPESGTSFYRMYPSEDIKMMWSVLSGSPDTLSNRQMTGSELLATCSEKQLLKDFSCSASFREGQLVTSISFPGQLLPYYLDIREYLISLIKSWRK